MVTALIISLLFLGVLIDENYGQLNLCTAPSNPPNGQVNCVTDRENVFLKCYATCNHGFNFPDTSVEFRSCNLVDGSWPDGHTFPDCSESTSRCQSLSPPKNGFIRCETINNQVTCTARCDDRQGYIFPSGQTSITRTCNATTGWHSDNNIPNCVADCNTHYLISNNPNVSDSDFMTSSTLTTDSKSFPPRKSDIFCINDCGWRPTSSDLNQFVQINLRSRKRVLGIVTLGLKFNAFDLYVTKFRILHSIDDQSFVPYSDDSVTDIFFTGNSKENATKLNVFDRPFEAQYIRINPLEWNNGIGLRFDLIGCDLDSTQNQRTTLSPVLDLTTHLPTHLVAGTTSIPVQSCSGILPPPNGAVNCQRNNNELSCTAICTDGFEFATNQLLVQRTCQIQTGQWNGDKAFPACIAKQVSVTTVPPNSNNCIGSQSDCITYGNGDFQTCGDCRYYATCSEGVLFVRPCPNNLQFDSILQTCQFKSRTCHSGIPFGK